MLISRIAIFASGSGTNAEALIKHFAHHPTIQVVMLLSNNPTAYALVRAQKHNIETSVFNKMDFQNPEVLLPKLLEKKITHLVLAGFLWLIPHYLVTAFSNRIVNIHPSLLPKYGGKGMYGMKVHEAVKQAGENETGITIHVVNEQYDEGQILFQATCGIAPYNTPEEIAEKIHELEHQHFSKVVEKWIGNTSM